MKILAIGNSFSQDAVEQYLYELAAADGIRLTIGNMYIDGCSLGMHLRNSRSGAPAYEYRKISSEGIRTVFPYMTLEKALADEDWDYVSLQQASPYSGLYETYERDLPEMAAYVRGLVGNTCRLILHQTWAYAPGSAHSGFRNYGHDQIRMYNAICDAVRRAAELADINIVVPAGTAVQNARTSFLGCDLTRDGYHLDPGVGRYIAACTWYEKLTGNNVMGNHFCPEGMSPEEQIVARRAAHDAVVKPYGITRLGAVPEASSSPKNMVFYAEKAC